MTPRDASGARLAAGLRRAVVVLAAVYLLVLPQFATYPSFVAAWRAQAIDPEGFVAGPLAIVLVGLGLWLMPVLLLASWVAEGRIRLPHPALAAPAVLVIVGAAVSTAMASDKAAALVRAAEVAGVWAAAWALAQAIASPGERRFLLAALVTAGVLAAAVAIHQAFIGYPEARAAYLAGRREAMGIEPGTWIDTMYIERFTGGVQAAFAHPNVLAAMLTLAVFAGIGLALEKWTEVGGRGAWALGGLAVGAAIVCGVAIVLTQSRGAVAAVAVGAYWTLVAARVPRGRRRTVLLLAPLVLAAVALAVATQVDHPAVTSALTTLRYRLDYWRATLRVLAGGGHWATGVGLENFGHHYVEHKLARAPEEVADPHNLVLSVWSTLGLAGLAGLVSLAVVAVRAWRHRGEARGGSPHPPRDDVGTRGGYGEPPRDAPRVSLGGLLLPTLVLAGVPLVLVFILGEGFGVAAVAVMAFGLGLLPSEILRRLELPARPLRHLRTVAIVGLLAFVLQEQIGTAVLVPPAAWAMLVVLVVTLGPGGGAPQASAPGTPRRRSGQAPTRRAGEEGGPIGLPVRFVLILSAMALVFAYARLVIVPIAQERRLLEEASHGLDTYGAAPTRAAAEANPLAWEPAYLEARRWHRRALEAEGPAAAIDMEKALAAYGRVLARHPRHRGSYLAMADCYLALPGAGTDPDLLRAALGPLQQAARLYPTHIPTRLRVARVLDELGRRNEALEAYREVLRLEEAMPMRGRGLSERGRTEVRRRIEALGG